ncbi:MAG: hypothetical protein K2L02_04370 [Clostridia bacterium]|nr:hypothetical protein [Clostridia bacterium]
MECTILKTDKKHAAFKTDDELAKEEPPIKAESLLQELLPFLKEYFLGAVSFDGQAIFYRMPNGQKIKISAREV